jgi:hypothetical protein
LRHRRPSQKKAAHEPDVLGGETRRAGKFLLQVCRQPFHHLLAVALGLLGLDNNSANVPIKLNQLAVDGNGRAKLRCADSRLEVGEKLAIANRERGGWLAILSANFCQTCGCCFSFHHTKILPAIPLPTSLDCIRRLRA